MTLYNEFRPASLDEVAQPIVSMFIKPQLEERQFRNGYIFYGSAGTGKTTIARIVACAALDPAFPIDNAELARENKTYQRVQANSHRDYVEKNCSDESGVDAVRAIVKDFSSVSPVEGECRVIVLDEVQRLSASAQNMLLKPLEEPAPGVIYILCTTDRSRIIPAILSRCEDHYFKPVSDKDVLKILTSVCKSKNWKFENEALEIIAKRSEGGVRSALVLLEKCSAIGDITAANTILVTGTASLELVKIYLKALNSKEDHCAELGDALKTIKESELDILSFVEDVISLVSRAALKALKPSHALLIEGMLACSNRIRQGFPAFNTLMAYSLDMRSKLLN